MQALKKNRTASPPALVVGVLQEKPTCCFTTRRPMLTLFIPNGPTRITDLHPRPIVRPSTKLMTSVRPVLTSSVPLLLRETSALVSVDCSNKTELPPSFSSTVWITEVGFVCFRLFAFVLLMLLLLLLLLMLLLLLFCFF